MPQGHGGLRTTLTSRSETFEAADAELRRLIREGFECPGEQLAEAAGLSVPRVYQIRDGAAVAGTQRVRSSISGNQQTQRNSVL